jgi:hypothetical protein
MCLFVFKKLQLNQWLNNHDPVFHHLVVQMLNVENKTVQELARVFLNILEILMKVVVLSVY